MSLLSTAEVLPAYLTLVHLPAMTLASLGVGLVPVCKQPTLFFLQIFNYKHTILCLQLQYFGNIDINANNIYSGSQSSVLFFMLHKHNYL